MTGPRVFYTGTVEYLEVSVTADVTLDAQPVEISFDRNTWHDAEWIGDPGTSRVLRILVDGSILPPKGPRFVFVRVTDTPEIPVILAGSIQVR